MNSRRRHGYRVRFVAHSRDCGKVRQTLPAAECRLRMRHCTSIFVTNDALGGLLRMHLSTSYFRLLCCLLLSLGSTSAAHAHDRATILYDAFGNSEHLKKDWGFSVLLEYAGKKILFDTGNDSKIFAANARELGIDLKDLDFVVISHRHGDHTSGLSHLLKVNPRVKIYAPAELFGVFGSTLAQGFYKTVDTLPENMRYFDGKEFGPSPTGSPWPGADFVFVDARL